MIKNLIRALLGVIGAIIGYGISTLVFYVAGRVRIPVLSDMGELQILVVSGITAIILGIIFFIIAPAISRQSGKLYAALGRELENVSPAMIVAGAIGLLFGLMIATLLAQLFRIISNRIVYTLVVVLVYVFFAYLGVTLATYKGKDVISALFSQLNRGGEARHESFPKKKGETPKIFDTSVIIDGRIAEVIKTGFLEGPIIIPDFVLVELRHIADSADSLKRTRGRRGLDILNKIRDDYGVEIYNTDNDKELKEIPEVDVKLLKLAQIIGGEVLTNDFNLNKVAGINGVTVLNINELANCLKPVVIPGENLEIALIKQGKDPNQAIGYLDDGTMIVCEDGKEELGNTVTIRVTSVLQTSAGRMIFGRLKKEKPENV